MRRRFALTAIFVSSLLLLAVGADAQDWAHSFDMEKYGPNCENCTYDKAYKKAQVGGKADKGIVIYLHGCEGLLSELGSSRVSGGLARWDKFFNEAGFQVIRLDAHDDVHPPVPAACKSIDEVAKISKEWSTALTINRIRQTHYAIARLREKHPGKKIIVWGYSQGANMAIHLGAVADGLMTIGIWCRLGTLEEFHWDTPVLYLLESGDPISSTNLEASGFSSHQEKCKGYFRSPAWRWHVVNGSEHFVDIGRPGVRQAASRFIQAVLGNN